MTAQRDFDRLMVDWLQADAPAHAPVHLADSVIELVPATRRRPAWRNVERWLPLQTPLDFGARLRLVPVLVVLALLLVLIGAWLVGSTHRTTQIVSPGSTPGLIAFVGEDQVLYESAVDGSDRHPISAADMAVFDAGAWSPRGDRIAYVESPRSAGKGSMELVVADADGSAPHVVVSSLAWQGIELPLRWSPDGLSIAYFYNDDVVSDTADLNVADVATGRIRTLSHNALPGQSDRGLYGAFSWSPDSRSIAFVQGDTPATFGIWVVGIDGSTAPVRLATSQGSLGSGSGAFVDLAWSPTSAQLAFTAVPPSDGPSRIHVVGVTGDPERALTGPSGSDREAIPVWSMVGDRIAFGRESVPMDDLSGLRPKYDLVVIRSDGTQPVIVTAPAPVLEGQWLWAADDATILAATDSGTFLLDPSNSQPPRQVPTFGAWQAVR